MSGILFFIFASCHPLTYQFLSTAKVTCIISHRKQDSIHKISKDEHLPNLCENMFACRKASFCWLQKNCTVQWVARYLHRYLEFGESLFTLDWQLHLSINEYVSYTAVKRTKFSFHWYKDLYIRWFTSKLWSEEKSTNGRKKAEKLVFYTGKLVKLQMKLEFKKLMAVAMNIWLLFCLDIQI